MTAPDPLLKSFQKSPDELRITNDGSFHTNVCVVAYNYLFIAVFSGEVSSNSAENGEIMRDDAAVAIHIKLMIWYHLFYVRSNLQPARELLYGSTLETYFDSSLHTGITF